MNTKIIKLKLIEKDMTIKEVANIIGVTEQTISNWINHRNTKQIESFIDLLFFLEINIIEIKNQE